MKYTLVINDKRIMRFHIFEVAKLYQTINGGTLFESNDDGDNYMEPIKEEECNS